MKFERFLLLSLAVLLAAPIAVAAQDEIPRRPDGKPDLSGAYDVATLTPLTRPREFGDRLTLTDEEAAAIARRKAEIYEADFKPSDPNREAPPVGGAPIFDPGLEVASGGSGGYNAFYMDPGDNVIRIDGKWRTSIITDPPNGQYPEMTPTGMARAAAQFAAFGHQNTGTAWWLEENEDGSGPYDNMEQRPLPERCLMGFSSTGGPPMLPALYNNHKRIVQTGNHVMILIEMVHDAVSCGSAASTRRPRSAGGWAIRSAGGKATPWSSTRRTSARNRDSVRRRRTCMWWSASSAFRTAICCTASRSKTRRSGRRPGAASTCGGRRPTRSSSTPATRGTTRWAT